ncbi:MAG TPA: 2-C-methyl-D-erythritol 4-phosphate cytidylyltransferase [Desulfobulbus sp.]|nr:2-C-methyl-D-erythritol 4-phosphate cytidylyltransferase [Desulfobulbus sp.]
MSRPSPDTTIRENSTPPAGVIIPAAGFGARMGSTTPKQFLELGGEPILIRTVKSFLLCPEIHAVVIAVAADRRSNMETLLAAHLTDGQQEKIILATGGATRQQSVKAAFDAMPADIQIILVHDGARPLISKRLILACLETIINRGAAIAAIPVHDTIKCLKADKSIGKTIDRTHLYRAQTPQGAGRHIFEKAYHIAQKDGFTGTDESSLFEHAGIPVAVVEGEEQNIKITRPGDLQIARGILEEKKFLEEKKLLERKEFLERNNPGEEREMLRIGHGFDAHRLVEERNLILGGEQIKYTKGLLGHSDADVLTHALIDGILGALGAGDIGTHFPDTDDSYKGINSLKLLEKVIGLTNDTGYTVANADLTILCQAPKLAPHLKNMRQNLAGICGISSESINIKATTTEKMGYIGRGEGIAAHAVVLLRKL